MKKLKCISTSFLVLIAACTNQKTNFPDDITQNQINQDTFLLPQKVVLGDLPDSLQPKIISQEEIETVTAIIPTSGKTPFVYSDPDGVVYREILEPPVTKMLPVLKDEKGKTVKDKNGNAYILGDGGISQFTSLTANDGLTLDIVTSAALDARGNLWFGSVGGGISCYDGNSFKTYTMAQGLANNQVRSIAADRKGNIWIGTDKAGLCRFDGMKFTTYTTEEGLSGNDIVSIYEDQNGRLWFSALDGGVSSFDGTTFTKYGTDSPMSGYFRKFFEDQNGNLHHLSSGSISRLEGDIFKKMFNDNLRISNARIAGISRDRTGNVWMSTYDGIYQSASIEDLINGKYVNYTIEDGLSSTYIRCDIADNEGNLWFRAINGGVTKYKPATDGFSGKFISFTSSQGLSDDRVNSITKDKSGSLWFGTQAGGVNRYDGHGFTTFSTKHGLGKNQVRAITEDKKGNLWFGTLGGGVSRFDGKAFTTYANQQGLPVTTVKCTYADNEGTIWFGAQGSLSRFVPSSDNHTGKLITYTNPELLRLFWSILQDKEGSIWIGTQGGGVAKLDDLGYTFYSTDQGLASNDVRSIAEDHMGNLWFGTFGSGLSCFDGTGFTSFTSEHGLNHDFVLCITADKTGNLWIGTQDGLSFLPKSKIESLSSQQANSDSNSGNDLSGEEYFFSNLTIEDGLPDNFISQIVELPNGKMAIGTNKGIALFDKPSNDAQGFDELTGLEIYNTSTGFPVKNINTGLNAMFLDSQGFLWAGTGSNETALVRCDFSVVRKKTEPVSVSFKHITLNDNDISWNDIKPELNALSEEDSLSFPPYITEEVTTFGRALKETERQAMRKKYEGVQFDDITPFYRVPVNLVLPYQHNDITIHYASDEMAKPNLVQYQYILEGYDEEWSPVVKNTYATFGNMYEGNYTFWVKARYTGLTEDGADSWSEPIAYTFRVLPPWYRSWWAYTFYGLLLIAGAFTVDRFQRRRLIEKERQKTREKELEQARETEKAYHDLKATQKQLIQSEKMASLGELTAGIAHEIQNPLNFVNNFSEVNDELLDDLKEAIANNDHEEIEAIYADLKANESKIKHHGQRAEGIVKGMLQHSRTSSGQKEPTDINALADEYLRLAYHGMRAKDKSFNAEFKTEFDPDLPMVSVVPQDIGRVLLNLINNAFYAVDRKAKQTADGYRPQVKITTMLSPSGGGQGEDFVEISVKDNGPGIPKEARDKIFQPFYTSKPAGEGTGLGLSLSYDIITKGHGGSIIVESEKGQDTTFIIKIPLKS